MARPYRKEDASGRRLEILEAAQHVLAERGYRATSMLEIARRAKASKETLYAWFGNKRGLFAALVRSNAAAINDTLLCGLERQEEDLRVTLTAFASELLRLLLSARALAVNRAAISEAATGDTTLGQILVANGRDNTVPRLVACLEAHRGKGRLTFDDSEEAAGTLIGLVVGDLQVRRLLGVLAMPEDSEVRARAAKAVEHFLKLYR
jgi:AcrR family transcriptional regulator